VDTPVTQLGTTQFLVLAPTPLESDASFGVGYTDAAPTADTSVTGLQDDVRVYNTALNLAALEAARMEGLQGGGGEFDAADFNEDGNVDGADLTAWQGGFGSATATHMQGDADEDMDADGADFLIWQRQLGTGGAGAAAVPEPSAGALLGLAVALGLMPARRMRFTA
jgi:hypothetical protein